MLAKKNLFNLSDPEEFVSKQFTHRLYILLYLLKTVTFELKKNSSGTHRESTLGIGRIHGNITLTTRQP